MHIFGDRMGFSSISPLHLGEKSVFLVCFNDTAESVFPKKPKEGWVIYFCFGQPGTPSSQPPPLDPMDYDKQYHSPETCWDLRKTTCLTINFRFKNLPEHICTSYLSQILSVEKNYKYKGMYLDKNIIRY